MALPSGNAVCSTEKRALAELRRRRLEAVLPVAVFGAHINDTGEVYVPTAEAVIQVLLDRIEVETARSDA